MNNKLSELSKPAAFIVRSPRGDVAYRTISQTDADYIARKGYASEPLYSQEYVSALLAELEAKDKRIAELEEQKAMWVSVGKELGSKCDALEAKLATPVRLPEGSGWASDQYNHGRNNGIHECKEAIRAAGFKCVGDE